MEPERKAVRLKHTQNASHARKPRRDAAFQVGKRAASPSLDLIRVDDLEPHEDVERRYRVTRRKNVGDDFCHQGLQRVELGRL